MTARTVSVRLVRVCQLLLGTLLVGSLQSVPLPVDAQVSVGQERYAGLAGLGSQPGPRPTPRPSPRASSGTVIGVASGNVYRDLPLAKARHDIRLLSLRDNVDVIGWQEVENWRDILTDLRANGWATKQFYGEPDELAVSWRVSEFRFRSAEFRRMHDGAGPRLTAVPFGPRFVIRVTLTQRSTGRTLTVLDTHVNSYIEDLDRPGHPRDNLNANRARLHLARMGDFWASVPGITWWPPATSTSTTPRTLGCGPTASLPTRCTAWASRRTPRCRWPTCSPPIRAAGGTSTTSSSTAVPMGSAPPS